VAPDYGLLSGFGTSPGEVLNVPASQGVLSKAFSPNQGFTEQLVASGPANGLSTYGAAVTVNPDGSFTYDPTGSALLQNLLTTGAAVIGPFEYSVTDPAGGTLDPTVSIVVSADFSGYKLDVVASQQGGFAALGDGPSINNLGHVGFMGTPANPGNVDS